MVGTAGVEPESLSPDSQSACAESTNPRGAESGALSPDSAPEPHSEAPGDTPPDADLQAVIAAWPSLPEAARARILAVVKAAEANGC